MLAGLRHERRRPVRVPGRHDVPQRPVLARRRRHPAGSEALRPAQGPDPHRGRTLCLPARHRAGERRLRQDRQAWQCTIPGSVPTSDGNGCYCPDGTHLDRQANACVRDKQKPEQCSIRGQIHDADGDCVCPRGTEVRNGACRPIRPKPEQCSIRGQIHNANGDCVCPDGTEVRGKVCRPIRPKPEQCTIRGQVHDANGNCVCPRGTEVQGNACRQKKPVLEQCDIRGQVHNKRGECVCPRGTQVINGACRKPRPQVECAPGSQMVGGQCVPIIKRRCPEGTVGRFPNCRAIRQQPSLDPTLLLNPGVLQQFIPSAAAGAGGAAAKEATAN